jgi:hypothetical protein
LNTRLPKLYITDAVYLTFILLYATDTTLSLIDMSGQDEFRILKCDLDFVIRDSLFKIHHSVFIAAT